MKFMDENDQISKIVYTILQFRLDYDLVNWNIKWGKQTAQLIVRFKERRTGN